MMSQARPSPRSLRKSATSVVAATHSHAWRTARYGAWLLERAPLSEHTLRSEMARRIFSSESHREANDARKYRCSILALLATPYPSDQLASLLPGGATVTERARRQSRQTTSKEDLEAALCRKQTGWPHPEQSVSQCSAHRLQRRTRGCSRCRSNLCLKRRTILHLLSLRVSHRASLELAHPCGLVVVDVLTISSVEHHAPLWGRRVRPDLMAAFAWSAHKAQRTQFRSRIPQLHKLPPRTSSRSRNACSKSTISLR